MSLEPSELLARLASTLRHEIGPAVGSEYERTQAFMASVILERVGRQLALGPGHARAAHDEVVALVPQLRAALGAGPPAVTAPLAALAAEPSVAGLGPLIEALYQWAATDPEAGVMGRDQALDVIRPVLRCDIDRQLEIAR